MLLLLIVFEAADAAGFEVTFAGAFLCDSAEPAADLAVLLVPELRSTFEAAVAAFLLVTSLFFVMVKHLHAVAKLLANFDRRSIIYNKERDNSEQNSK